MRLSLIHCANTLLSIPGISKSAAADLLSAQCSLVIFEPISMHNSAHRNPEDIISGLSNSLRTGCKIFTASAFKFLFE
jgi:hypothetical protein